VVLHRNTAETGARGPRTVGDYLPETEGWPLPRQNSFNTGRFDTAARQPTVTLLTSDGKNVSIKTVKNRVYQLLRKSSLDQPWTPLTTVTGAGGVMNFLDATSAPMGFYSIRID
jgi:hypothetical protein